MSGELARVISPGLRPVADRIAALRRHAALPSGQVAAGGSDRDRTLDIPHYPACGSASLAL